MTNIIRSTTGAEESEDVGSTGRSDKHNALAASEPNWNDPRVQRAAAKGLAFAKAYFSPYIAKQIYATKLYDGVGRPDRPIGKFLHEAVLIREGNYKVQTESVKGHPFSYRLNPAGIEYVESKLDASIMIVASSEMVEEETSSLAEKYAGEVESLAFNYKEGESGRLNHGLQHMPSVLKFNFWKKAGLPHNYDIEACAPTILQQLSEKCGQNWLIQEPIKKYLSNKAQMRKRIAELVGIEYQVAKRILNSLFNGARLQCSDACSIFQILGRDRRKMRKLQEDVELKLLRTSIKNMWTVIAAKVGRSMKTGSSKWQLYFHLERKVLNVIVQFLVERNVKHFTEHDGFRTDVEVDCVELSERIRRETGFALTISKDE